VAAIDGDADTGTATLAKSGRLRDPPRSSGSVRWNYAGLRSIANIVRRDMRDGRTLKTPDRQMS
jgi:hypothetical protein